MRHNVKGRKLKRTSSHKKALMRSLVTQLLEHKRIHTTEAKAKELRPYAEKIITKAFQREQQGLLEEGQKYDVHTRRLLGRDIRKKSVIESLFDDILPEIGERPGGYTRVVKTGVRRGDAGSTALIELVDFNREIVGTTKKKSSRPKTKKTTKTETTPVATLVEEPVAVEEVVAPVEEVSAETTEVIEVVEEVTEVTNEEAVAEETTETPTDETSSEETSDDNAEEKNS
jgi:large subunit ribosomal protein L17